MMKKTTSLAEPTANDKLELYLTNTKLWRNLFAFALLLTLTTFAGINANAATFTVTSNVDSGAGTLRQAILDANSLAGPDTIVFDGSFPLVGLSSELNITSDITIDGSMVRGMYISGGNVSRIFNVVSGNLTINSLSLTGGRAPTNQDGGCIQSATTGTVTINRSTLFSCGATNGGAIVQTGGSLVLRNSTFFANSATVGGGTLMVNSNTATATIVSCTIVSNSASSNGGAIRVTAGNLAMGNTIVANNNAPTNPDVSGNVTSQGYNLIKNTTGAVITGITTGNLTGVDPTLELFSDNGGGMFTSAPSRSSIVVDAGDPGRSSDLDQRRARRNTDGNLNGIAGVDIGAIEKQRTAYDADGEDSADLSVTRIDQNTNYVWYSGMRIVNSFVELMDTNPNAYFQQKFGLSTDTKVPGDYDGDGRMDPAVYRASQGLWYIFGSTSGLTVLQWGLPNDVPVPADYDGDGRTDIATYRAGVWYVLKSTQGFTGAVTLGTATDKPVPADYDGDLKADIAIFGNGVWTINRSTAGPTSAQFGITGDVPVPADYSGDGIDDLAVFRPNSGTWYIQKVGGFDAFPFGLATDKLVPADYDGDGKIDIAVWRSNTMTGKGDLYVQRSRDGYTLANFGFSTDVPTQNALIRQ